MGCDLVNAGGLGRGYCISSCPRLGRPGPLPPRPPAQVLWEQRVYLSRPSHCPCACGVHSAPSPHAFSYPQGHQQPSRATAPEAPAWQPPHYFPRVSLTSNPVTSKYHRGTALTFRFLLGAQSLCPQGASTTRMPPGCHPGGPLSCSALPPSCREGPFPFPGASAGPLGPLPLSPPT